MTSFSKIATFACLAGLMAIACSMPAMAQGYPAGLIVGGGLQTTLGVLPGQPGYKPNPNYDNNACTAGCNGSGTTVDGKPGIHCQIFGIVGDDIFDATDLGVFPFTGTAPVLAAAQKACDLGCTSVMANGTVGANKPGAGTNIPTLITCKPKPVTGTLITPGDGTLIRPTKPKQ